MNSAGFATWIVLRVLRWVIWASFLVYSFRVVLDKTGYVDAFSRPLRSTEMWMFGLPLIGVTLGLLELMMRERSRIPRAGYFRLKPTDVANHPVSRM